MPEKKNKKKQPYQKPVIKIIELSADEVLATGCKTSSSGTFLGTACIIGASSCSVDGS